MQHTGSISAFQKHVLLQSGYVIGVGWGVLIKSLVYYSHYRNVSSIGKMNQSESKELFSGVCINQPDKLSLRIGSGS